MILLRALTVRFIEFINNSMKNPFNSFHSNREDPVQFFFTTSPPTTGVVVHKHSSEGIEK